MKKEPLAIDHPNASIPVTRRVRLWHAFRGRRNTDDLLADKARLLATVLCEESLALSKRLLNALRERQQWVDEARLWPVSVEVLLFLVHYLDRLSFVVLGNERQEIFMQALIAETKELLAGAYEEAEESVEFLTAFSQWITARQAEYSRYKKMLPDEGESQEQTLFWEVEKKFAEVLGFDSDPYVMLVIRSTLIRLIEVLDLGRLLADCQPE